MVGNERRRREFASTLFISAATLVPGNASGGMDGVAVKPLTVGCHETPLRRNAPAKPRRRLRDLADHTGSR
jgi:hypothetical protein